MVARLDMKFERQSNIGEYQAFACAEACVVEDEVLADGHRAPGEEEHEEDEEKDCDPDELSG